MFHPFRWFTDLRQIGALPSLSRVAPPRPRLECGCGPGALRAGRRGAARATRSGAPQPVPLCFGAAARGQSRGGGAGGRRATRPGSLPSRQARRRGAQARAGTASRVDEGTVTPAVAPSGVVDVLVWQGYEPYQDGTAVRLGNCPFRDVATQFPAVVCGMNLALLEGLVDGAGAVGTSAVMDPRPGQCCVALVAAEPGRPGPNL